MGDQLTTVIQPFWALPVLGIAGLNPGELKARRKRTESAPCDDRGRRDRCEPRSPIIILTEHDEPARTEAATARARPSMLDGGELPTPEVTTMGAALVRAAADDSAGVICHLRADAPSVEQSYANLEHTAARVLNGMRRRGARPQDKVLLHIDDDPLLLVAFWACVLGGFVPMPMTTALSGGTLDGLDGLWRQRDRVSVLTSRADNDAYRVPDPSSAQYDWLGEIEDLAAFAPARSYHEAEWDDLALLLLTSGSTGAPKAVQLSHGNVLSRCVGAVTTNALDREVNSFNWLPFDHVGGLIMFHFRDVYLRCRQVHARMGWVISDPLRWLDAMSRHRSTMTWAPNFAFRLINDKADQIARQDWDLSALCHIMNGGEPIYPDVLRRFVSLLEPFGLPAHAVYPGWGMSEPSSGVVDCRFDPYAAETDQRFFPVGQPHPGVQLRVVDDQDRDVPDGTVGSLQAAGNPITRGYYNAPEPNRDTFTVDGWFRTSDLAYIEHGVLTVRGRVHDVITVDGIECHAHEVEAVAEDLEVATCSYVVATPVRVSASGREELVVFFNPRTGVHPREGAVKIHDAVLAGIGIRPRYVLPVTKEDIRKTEIGKLRRPELRHRFESEWASTLEGADDTAALVGHGGDP